MDSLRTTRVEYLLVCSNYGAKCCYQERRPERDVPCSYCGAPTKVQAVCVVPYGASSVDGRLSSLP